MSNGYSCQPGADAAEAGQPPINDQTRSELMATTIRHTTVSHIGYLRGKLASEWIDAISKRRRPCEHTP